MRKHLYNHLILFGLLSLLALSLASCDESSTDDPVTKTTILMDTDMCESFDDGIALMVLMGTDHIDVKGVTTVTTNFWSQESLAYAIRLGELCKGESTTFIAGSRVPMRQGRLETLDKEINAAPGNDADWRGAASYPEVTDWKAFYLDRYHQEPTIQPSQMDASEFIAQQILSAPGQITLLEIGACTNIAKALTAHPEIAEKTKEIIYMGGAIHCPGNTTTYAEMNFLYDPEAAAICLRAPFPKQTLVSLDVCNTMTMDFGEMTRLVESVHSKEIQDLIKSNYPYPEFLEDPDAPQMIWDLISGAIAVDPGIISKYQDVRLDIDDNPDSSTYGKSYVTSDSSRQIIRVPLKINKDRFWEVILSGMGKH